MHQSEQFGVGQLDPAIVARRVAAIEREARAVADQRLAIGKGADAQLGSLQIGQDGDGPRELAFHGANGADGFGMDRVFAVAHVHAEGIGPCLEQRFQHVGIAAGGANRGEDLDLAVARFELHGRRYDRAGWQFEGALRGR